MAEHKGSKHAIRLLETSTASLSESDDNRRKEGHCRVPRMAIGERTRRTTQVEGILTDVEAVELRWMGVLEEAHSHDGVWRSIRAERRRSNGREGWRCSKMWAGTTWGWEWR